MGLLLLSCSDSNSSEPMVPEEAEQEEDKETLEQPTSNVDYGAMQNWVFHPNQSANLLSVYNLDIGLIDRDLNLEGGISVENNANTNTGVDVFFVHPTILENAATEATIVALENQPTTLINFTVLAQGGQLAKYGRFYAPRYRQSTANTYLDQSVSKEEQTGVIMRSYSDVKAAFMNYWNNYNNGNKIILAGHSQGSYLLSMLVRDVFDTDASFREKLVTAALGGMGHIYAAEGEYVGGQFENIPLCLQIEECGCVQGWRSYEDGQTYNDTRPALPMFNEELVKYGVFNRTVDLDKDWFIMDEAYLSENQEPVRYIALSANVNEDHGFNYVAHDNLYLARTRRDSNTEIGLNITYSPEPGDQRSNDLALEAQNPLFEFWGYHPKDYATYLWPLLEQIDTKLANCN